MNVSLQIRSAMVNLLELLSSLIASWKDDFEITFWLILLRLSWLYQNSSSDLIKKIRRLRLKKGGTFKKKKKIKKYIFKFTPKRTTYFISIQYVMYSLWSRLSCSFLSLGTTLLLWSLYFSKNAAATNFPLFDVLGCLLTFLCRGHSPVLWMTFLWDFVAWIFVVQYCICSIKWT